jgi:hypothetical protein
MSKNKPKFSVKKEKIKKKQQIHKIPPKVKGHGDYSFSSLGRQIGGYLGEKAGGLVSSVVGFGDYKIKTNTLMNQTPNFKHVDQIRIQRKEFCGVISGTANFLSFPFEINPTNPYLFPWLSKIAYAFEEYEIHGMIMHYKPTSGMITGSNTKLGSVVFATQYNPYAAPFESKQQMENTFGASSCSAVEHMLHGIECDRSEQQQPILSVRQPTGNQDKRFSVLGILNICTHGCPVNEIGEGWITYDITLRNGIINVAKANWHYKIDSSIIADKPFGTSQLVPESGSQNECFTIAKGGNTIVFNDWVNGRYKILYNYYATTPDPSHAWNMAVSGGCTNLSIENGDSVFYAHGASTTSDLYTWDVSVTNGGTVTLTNASFGPSGLSGGDLTIIEIGFKS